MAVSTNCDKMLACDGVELRAGRKTVGYCTACEKALAKRGKVVAPRGLNCDSNKTAREIRKAREAGTWKDW